MACFAKISAVLIFVSLFRNGDPANILGLMGCASHSHHLWNEVIIETLAKKGHTLTIVSVDKTDPPKENISYIHLEATYSVINEYYNKGKDQHYLPSFGPLSSVRMLYDYQMLTCKGIIQSNGFKEAQNLEEKFDLILYDLATGPCLLRLIQKYPDMPVVGVSAFKMAPEILDIFGGHNYPSYIPLFVNQLDVPMNLWQRLFNTVAYVISDVYRKYVTDPIIDSMAAKQIPGPKASLDSLYKRLEIALVNTHPAIDFARSLPPNIIEIGGLHIKEAQPLPEDINEFVESAEKGAVFISLGTNVPAEALGEKRLEMFLNVIKKLPKYNFLWKIEKEGLIKDVPENLLVRKWFPQKDILAHPNVKTFFTHAGGLSIQEAVWNGVPVVAMPLFLDQIHNAHQVQVEGFGRVVDFAKLTEASLFQGLFGVLTDETYRSNALDKQKQFRDRQNNPLETAIWWIEYVLRNPRADHLISASRNMSYFLSSSLDVVFIGVTICIIFLVNLWIVLRNIRGTFSKPKSKSSSKISKSKELSKKKIKKN